MEFSFNCKGFLIKSYVTVVHTYKLKGHVKIVLSNHDTIHNSVLIVNTMHYEFWSKSLLTKKRFHKNNHTNSPKKLDTITNKTAINCNNKNLLDILAKNLEKESRFDVMKSQFSSWTRTRWRWYTHSVLTQLLARPTSEERFPKTPSGDLL